MTKNPMYKALKKIVDEGYTDRSKQSEVFKKNNVKPNSTNAFHSELDDIVHKYGLSHQPGWFMRQVGKGTKIADFGLTGAAGIVGSAAGAEYKTLEIIADNVNIGEHINSLNDLSMFLQNELKIPMGFTDFTDTVADLTINAPDVLKYAAAGFLAGMVGYQVITKTGSYLWKKYRRNSALKKLIKDYNLV